MKLHNAILLAAASLLTLAGNAFAQAYTTLHSFDGTDGAFPGSPSLVQVGDTLYGVGSGQGTLFSFGISSNSFQIPYRFGGVVGEGVTPAGLVSSGDMLYGTTFATFGNVSKGTLYSFNTASQTLTFFTPSPALPPTAMAPAVRLLFPTTSSMA